MKLRILLSVVMAALVVAMTSIRPNVVRDGLEKRISDNYMPPIKVDGPIVEEKFKNGIHHLGNDDICIAFRSLEWWTYSLIEPAGKISSGASTRVFVDTENQSGPLVLAMRGIMTWTELMNEVKVKLETTKTWSSQTQLEVSQCYLDYAYQAATFLQVLESQGCGFDPNDPSRCLMHEKLEAAHVLYQTVATMLYGTISRAVQDMNGLITADFPKRLPPSFDPQCGVPEPEQPIREFIATYDTPVNEKRGFFRSALNTWACGNPVPCSIGPSKNQK